MTIEELTERLSCSLSEALRQKIEATIPEMVKQVESSSDLIARKDEEIASLRARLEAVLARIEGVRFEKNKAEAKAKEQEWIANELGKFVRDIANGIYEGQEIAAARRVYDLNSGTLAKKRINACNYDSVEAAKEAFMDMHAGQGIAEEELLTFYKGLLEWLFQTVPNG